MALIWTAEAQSETNFLNLKSQLFYYGENRYTGSFFYNANIVSKIARFFIIL